MPDRIFDLKNKEKLIEYIMNLLIEVNDKIILSYFKNLHMNDISTKTADDDFVTIADKKSEDWLSNRLLGYLNISEFVGEETSYKNNNFLNLLNEPLIWIIDPIDGTKNYVKGDNKFCSMISIASYGIPIATFVYQPLKKQMVYALKGCGTFLINVENNIKQQISIPKVDENKIIGSGSTKGIPEIHKDNIMKCLKTHTQRVFIGSAGIEAMMLAKNEIQFIFHGRVTPWDHSPLSLIVKEAGGFVYMARDKEPFSVKSEGPILAASNLNIWNKIRNITIPIDSSYRI